MQKLFAVYFKFHGLSARALDTLHWLGLVMSTKWTTDCVAELAADSKQELLSLRDNQFWIMSHDNVNIAFKVYSQQVNKQTHFDSGTAATVYVKPTLSCCPIVSPRNFESRRLRDSQSLSRLVSSST